jgi:hypothetical protein
MTTVPTGKPAGARSEPKAGRPLHRKNRTGGPRKPAVKHTVDI